MNAGFDIQYTLKGTRVDSSQDEVDVSFAAPEQILISPVVGAVETRERPQSARWTVMIGGSGIFPCIIDDEWELSRTFSV